jgi:methionyl aminopeptidase
MKIKIYKQEDFAKMRVAGRLAATILDLLYSLIKVGTTTEEINDFCHKLIIQNNAIPAPLGYHGFPKSVCTSINEVICHGIPDSTKLKDGDIINVDVTVIVDSYYGDTSRMYVVGDSFKDANKNLLAKRLIKTTYECMMLGIKAAKPNASLLDVGKVIQNHAHKNGFSVVRDFCGHGIGTVFHEEPQVLHYYPEEKSIQKFFDLKLKPGMIFTIEPMINEGTWHSVVDKKDGWTARTVDGKLSAQFEHTIGITQNGCEIFTQSAAGLHLPEVC